MLIGMNGPGRTGSAIDLLVRSLEESPHLEDVEDYTADSGRGRWTLLEAVERGMPLQGTVSVALWVVHLKAGDQPHHAECLRTPRPVWGT